MVGAVRGGRVVGAPQPVALGASLRVAFAALAGVDTGFVPVVDGGWYVGVVTPVGIYRALRESAHRAADEAAAEHASEPARTHA